MAAVTVDIGWITTAVEVLKATGPLGLAVLACWWGWWKDREAWRIAKEARDEAKAIHEQVTALVATQVAATTRLEGAVSALKDALLALRTRGL